MAGKPSDADLLPLPSIPKPKKDDPEDVAWALSTAEAMWNRAENADAIKWIRRAAEAASEAEADDRALELAKAAADLASMLVRVEPTAEQKPSERPPNTLQSQTPPPPVAPLVAPLVGTTPHPPSIVPPPPGAAQLVRPSTPPKAPSPARAAPPQAALPKVTHSRAGERRRRSSANLNDEAKRAAAHEIAVRSGGEQEVTRPFSASGKRQSTTNEARRRRSKPALEEIAQDPNETGSSPAAFDDKHDTDPPQVPDAPGTSPRRMSQTDEIDQWPTQSLNEDDLPAFDDQHTRIGTPAYSESARRPVDPKSALRPAQAVRVIVWRAADGVHVAPAGTTVSAITVDALLVALDPNADLTAWLKG